MQDYSSRDAAQRRDTTSKVSTGNTSKPFCKTKGNADSLIQLCSHLCAGCRKTRQQLLFHNRVGFYTEIRSHTECLPVGWATASQLASTAETTSTVSSQKQNWCAWKPKMNGEPRKTDWIYRIEKQATGERKKNYSGLNVCWLSWRRRVCWIELLTELACRFTPYSNSQTGAALPCPRAVTADTQGGTYHPGSRRGGTEQPSDEVRQFPNRNGAILALTQARGRNLAVSSLLSLQEETIATFGSACLQRARTLGLCVRTWQRLGDRPTAHRVPGLPRIPSGSFSFGDTKFDSFGNSAISRGLTISHH